MAGKKCMNIYQETMMIERGQKVHNVKFIQAKQGKQKEFEASLRRLRGKNSDISAEAAEIQVCINS